MVKNPPAMQETWVRSLGWEDPPKEGVVTHSSILAWRISMDRGACRLQSLGVTKRLGTAQRVELLVSRPTVVWGLYCASLFWGWNFSHLIKIQEAESQ